MTISQEQKQVVEKLRAKIEEGDLDHLGDVGKEMKGDAEASSLVGSLPSEHEQFFDFGQTQESKMEEMEALNKAA